MSLQKHQTIGTRVVMLHEIKKIRYISEAFRHLFTLGVNDEAIVHPVIGESFSECNSLRALVFVMRKLEVHAATMQIKSLTQKIQTHDHTFAVPTWTTRTPRRIPRWFTGLTKFP